MIYSIHAELMSKSLGHALKVTIVRGNNLNLFTTIPTKNGQKITFDPAEELSISYYLGDFHYHFNIEYKETIEEENLYSFIINEVEIEKNLRKQKRELVELNALILDSKSMYYATILDISDSGMKIETSSPIEKTKIEIHFVRNNETVKRKGKIVWSSNLENEFYYYGVRLK